MPRAGPRVLCQTSPRPFSSSPSYSSRRPLVSSLACDETSASFAAGEIVAIFPEGRLSSDGEVGEFRPGYRRLLGDREVPVIAIGLNGLWWSCGDSVVENSRAR
ncbi:1-acyl-sn-glycerol-3-phosphate acyltransferase [Burkholderia cenocepacia]|uniref:1-acyl-sn-glycerol-3-phosphate acyltransferase n=1 Tax=Burkholderia cenocepacia TaxID=95486 RepID=UPI0009B3D1DA